jgi:hypothetical protein
MDARGAGSNTVNPGPAGAFSSTPVDSGGLMEFKFKVVDSRVVVRITYSRKIWELLERIYQRHGLERRTISRGWGEDQRIEVYRIPESVSSPFEDVIEHINRKLGNSKNYYRVRVIDDINQPLVTSYCEVNVAFMRIVPTCSGDICHLETDAPMSVYCLAALKILPKILVDLVKYIREIEKPRIAEIVVKFK